MTTLLGQVSWSFLGIRLTSDLFSAVISHDSVFSSLKKVLHEFSTLSSALTEVNLDFIHFKLTTLIQESLSRQTA